MGWDVGSSHEIPSGERLHVAMENHHLLMGKLTLKLCLFTRGYLSFFHQLQSLRSRAKLHLSPWRWLLPKARLTARTAGHHRCLLAENPCRARQFQAMPGRTGPPGGNLSIHSSLKQWIQTPQGMITSKTIGT